jgi:hypothetical protein
LTPREVRAELKLAGMAESEWKEVVHLAQSALHYRQGRYYPVSGPRVHLEKEQEQRRAIDKAIRKLIRLHKAESKSQERRGRARIDFIQPVQVTMEDGKTYQLLSRDLSTSGIRLLGTKHLLGHKVHVDLPQGSDEPPCRLLVRILWTCAVGDDLFENGGMFLEVSDKV